MFSSRLEDEKTLVLSRELQGEFSNIVGLGTFRGDNFALAVARLFLKPRMQPDEIVTIRVDDMRTDTFADEIFLNNTVTFCTRERIADVDFRLNNSRLTDEWEEFENKELDLIETQLSITIRIFRNKEKKNTIIVTNAYDYGVWHCIVSFFNIFCPWYIEELTDAELKFATSLLKKNATTRTVCEMMDLMVYDMVDVDAAKKKYYLNGYENKLRRIQREKFADQMKSTRQMIGQLMQELRQLYKNYETNSLIVSAIDNSTAEDSNELMNYFLYNKNVSVESGDENGYIMYVITGYMSLFDPEVAKEYINNPNSLMYAKGTAYGLAEEKIRNLMTEIFINSTIKVRMCSAWELCLGSGVSPIRSYPYSKRYKNYLPNPHLDLYGCMGGWQSTVEESCEKLDYVFTVDTTCAENGNLNLNDTIVFGRFLEKLFSKDIRVLELPTGDIVDYIDAIKWMEGK